jgi:hypothetical protein
MRDYQMNWETIVIQNVLPDTRTAFGIREATGEQVFIGPSISKTVGLAAGDIVLGKLTENHNQPAGKSVPWKAFLVTRDPSDIIDLEEAYERLCGFEYPMTAEEADIPLIALQELYLQGRIVKMVVMETPQADKILMWASSMEKV